ncbi:unnamed protein product [Moneuplotes crassus]|uniref:Uncharacterized protein n=1 Tax=Euplotes crassus TaxID=5936 RepID=A0AAD1UFL7_EUPCR|nr:unnamed protein product [Moneuplotes crassus]
MLNQYFRKNYIKAKKQADRFEELQQCKKIWKDNKRLFSNLKNCKGQLFKERRCHKKAGSMKSLKKKALKKTTSDCIITGKGKVKTTNRSFASFASFQHQNFSARGYESGKDAHLKFQRSFDSFSSEPYSNRLENSLDRSMTSLQRDKIKKIDKENQRILKSLRNIKPTICIKNIKSFKSLKNLKSKKAPKLSSSVEPLKDTQKTKLKSNTKPRSKKRNKLITNLNLPDINLHIPCYKRNDFRVKQFNSVKNSNFLALIKNNAPSCYSSFERRGNTRRILFEDRLYKALQKQEETITHNIKAYLDRKPAVIPEVAFTDASTKSNSSLSNYKKQKISQWHHLLVITEEKAPLLKKLSHKKGVLKPTKGSKNNI